MVFKVFCRQHGVNVLCFTSSRFVYVWDAMTQQLIYKLPGHRGSVNDVDFHPSEPIRKLCSQGRLWCGLLCVSVATPPYAGASSPYLSYCTLVALVLGDIV